MLELSTPTRDVDRGSRALVAAIIRQAVLDLKATKLVRNKYVHPNTSVTVIDYELQQSAKNFLRSKDCEECAMILGISQKNIQALVAGI